MVTAHRHFFSLPSIILLIVAWPSLALHHILAQPSSDQDQLKEACWKLLEKGLRDEEPKNRAISAVALGLTRDPKAIPYLQRALGDRQSGVRRYAVRSLGRIQDPEAIPILKHVLLSRFFNPRDPSDGVRAEAIRSLDRIGEENVLPLLRKALRDPAKMVRLEAIDALVSEKDWEAVPMIRKATQDPRPGVRSKALWALGRSGDPSAAPILLKALASPYPEIRGQAALALSLLREERAVPRIIALLEDEVDNVRGQAVVAIAGFKTADHQRYIAKALRDKSDEVRESAVWAHESLGVGEMDLLRNALFDSSCRVKIQAAGTLAKQKDFSGFPMLTACLADTSLPDRFRAEAAWMLRFFPQGMVWGSLQPALIDSSPEVRLKGALALKQLNSKNFLQELDRLLTSAASEDRRLSVKISPYLPPAQMKELLDRTIQDPDLLIRMETVAMLYEKGDEAFLSVFQKALGDPNRKVRVAALVALFPLHKNVSPDLLESVLGDEDEEVQVRAVELLGVIGGEKAFSLARKMMHADLRLPVRLTAASTLLRILSNVEELSVGESVPGGGEQ